MATSINLNDLEKKIKDQNLNWTVVHSQALIAADLNKVHPLGVDTNRLQQQLEQIHQAPAVNMEHVIRRSGVMAARAMPMAMAAAPQPLPASVDWRDYNHVNYITPIKDQMQCGSCVAFGVTSVLEAMVRREHWITTDLAEADLFYCGGGSCANGWTPGDAINYLKGHGEPLEECFPYVDVQTACNSRADRDQLAIKPANSEAIIDNNDRKRYLAYVGPMVACFDVYEDFDFYSSGVYKHVTGKYRGGHCITVIGYDDQQGAWICKNSWGTGWGNQGYFLIAYGQCGIDNDTVLFGMHFGSSFWGLSGTALPDRYRERYFTNNFAGGVQHEVLAHSPATQDWLLGTLGGGGLAWKKIGNTAGFGTVADGRPIWTSDFNCDGRADVLFYYPGDGNWWLGSYDGNTLNWSLVSNTTGFGNLADGRPIWIGDFNGDGGADVLFYYPGDDNWWLGAFNAGQIQWSLVSNTAGFGHGINDGRPFWIGDFNADGKAEVLFYYPGDDNWWMATLVGGQFQWSLVGNTAGFGHGINDGRPFWVGDFNGDHAAEMLFYFPGDDNWWMGVYKAGQLQWSFVGNTAGFGHGINDGRPFWVGNFNGGGQDEMLFYFPGDQNWWIGNLGGGQLQWHFAGNTSGFGQIWDGRPMWEGAFSGAAEAEIMFMFPGDQNWWLGKDGTGQLNWSLVGNSMDLWQLA